MAIEIKAPGKYPLGPRPVIFLGGVIDNGSATDWQADIVKKLDCLNVVLLNPRRSDWDPNWKQEISNPMFKAQVEWELRGQEQADLNIYVFAPDDTTSTVSKAPITLLELGLYAPTNHVMVCCPTGYYRKGNVDIVCERYVIPVFETLDELAADVIKRFHVHRVS